ncbi:MAG: efflux RND transporter periplasmic adaptor subunit [Deltaproteobacteria bacterium]|nr:efflux RND transporter periplasmic adaptor subunit [Deltaproteobacteria bacterium]
MNPTPTSEGAMPLGRLPLICSLVLVASILACASPLTPSTPEPSAIDGADVEAGDWCAEHALPESMCTVCNPGLIDGFKASGDWCAEHGFPESVCPICNPVEPPPGAGAFVPGTRIRFRSPELEAKVGIQTARVGTGGLGVGVEATARVSFDANRVAEVHAPVAGVVREVKVDLGDTVTVGTPLVVVESGAVGELRARLAAAKERSRTAEAGLGRQRELLEAGITSPRQVELATQESESAASEVRGSEAALRAAGATGEGTSGRYSVSSPLAGTIVRRPAVLGSAVSGTDLLVMVADTSRVWALLDVREEDVARVLPGQPVTVAVDGVDDRAFEGEITWVAAEVDPRTRTVTARAELDNADGLLRAHQFGRAVIGVESPEHVVSVPRAAVQRLDDGSVVFVRLDVGLYEPRAVDVGRAVGDRVAVHGPLEPGEEVVTTGAFLLKTELRRDAIGAGCCEIEEPGG